MAVTHTPIYVQVPNIGKAAIAAANAARDGSGTIVTAFTAGGNGSYIKRVRFTSSQATAAASSGMVGRIWVSIDGGTSWTLLFEIGIAIAIASNTVIGSTGLFEPPAGLQVQAGALIGVTISVYAGVQDRMVVVVEGGDY